MLLNIKETASLYLMEMVLTYPAAVVEELYAAVEKVNIPLAFSSTAVEVNTPLPLSVIESHFTV